MLDKPEGRSVCKEAEGARGWASPFRMYTFVKTEVKVKGRRRAHDGVIKDCGDVDFARIKKDKEEKKVEKEEDAERRRIRPLCIGRNNQKG